MHEHLPPGKLLTSTDARADTPPCFETDECTAGPPRDRVHSVVTTGDAPRVHTNPWNGSRHFKQQLQVATPYAL